MIFVMTVKKLKKICDDYFHQGLVKGYELGYKMRQIEKSNKGCIISSKLDGDIEAILKEKWGDG